MLYTSIRKLTRPRLAGHVVLMAGLVLVSGATSRANPTGGVVTAGSASINNSPGTVAINQSSNTAIINWQTFSIGSGELTKFIQPSANSAVLNRVLGGQTSIIDGTLSANGQVFLINGNGILVGQGGTVNTNGFTASTRDIADNDFLLGNFHFTGSNDAGVQNFGTINALGGDAILIGKTVSNQGTLQASNGTAGLAAADDVLITQTGSQHVFVNATASAKAAASKTGVSNTGLIKAASAELRAANGNIYALAINNAGTVRATNVTEEGGDIYLTSDDGTVQNSGTLDASATAAGGQGGSVTLKSSSGTTIHAGKILAKGGQGGSGGNADISGAQVQFSGQVDLTAPGGKTGNLLIDPTTLNVITGGTVTSGSFTSSGGTDTNPVDTGAADTVDPSVVDGLLASANVTLNADSSITITNGITWTSANTLSLITNNNLSTININAPISGVNGGLILSTTNNGTITPTAAVNVNTFELLSGAWKQVAGVNGVPATLPDFSAPQDFELKNNFFVTFERMAGGTGSSSNPFQITDIYGLQGLASPSGFFYLSSGARDSFVLNNNIDATVTQNWRGGDGFVPIGASAKPSSFDGTFNGNNFVIKNLYEHWDGNSTPLMKNDNGNVGLFSYTSGSLSSVINVSLTGVDLSMVNDTTGLIGGLVANNSVNLTNDSVTGKITGTVAGAAGGLVGESKSGTITSSNAAVNVNVTILGTGSAVGGLIGDNEGIVSVSYATGNVTIIAQTTATGTAVNGAGAGGFIGYEGGTGSITDCYALGAVHVTDLGNDPGGYTLESVGGFAGEVEDGTVQSVYSIGLVTESSVAGNGNVGIFAGDVQGSGVSDCYARTDNQLTVGALVGFGNAANVNPPSGGSLTGGVILTSSTIDFIDGSTWFQATSATGPTKGFPVLTNPVTSLDTTTLSLSDNVGLNPTYGQSITLTATLADTTNTGTTVTGGTVSFDQGGTTILTPVNVTGDTVTLNLPSLLNASGTAYDFTASYSGATGFAASTTTSSLAVTVAQAALVVTAGTGTKIYGSTTPSFAGQSFTASGLVAGTSDSVTSVTYGGSGIAATAGVNGGTPYTLTASSAKGSGLANYHITYDTGTLTVTPATLSYVATGVTSTYGSTLPGFAGNVTGFVNTDNQANATTGTLSFTSTATATSNAGSYAINGSGLTASNGNYTFVQAAGNATALTINPATLTYTATAANSTYGSTLPGFTGAVTGFVNTDNQNNATTGTLSFTSTATAASNAGSYAINGSGLTANNGNYTFAQAAGNANALTIGPANLTITAGTATKTYGSTTLNYAGPQFTTSTLFNGDTVTGVNLTSAGQAATAGVNGGTPYTLTASAATGTGLSNYSISYNTGTVTVNPATLTLTASDQIVNINASVNVTPTLNTTYTVTGLQNTDQLTGVLATGPTLTCTQSTATAASYPNAITMAGTLNNSLGANYTLNLVNGNLTVKPPVPDTTTITLSDNAGLNPTYGQSITLTATLADTSFPGLTVTGGTVTFDQGISPILSPVAVTGDTVTLNLPALLNASGTAYDFSASYSGTLSFAAVSTASPLALTVAQKALVITAGSATKTYGSTTLSFTGQQFTDSGLVAGTGDSVTAVTFGGSGVPATAGVNGGTPYALTANSATGSGLSNYAITYDPGVVTVNPATLTYAATAANQTYGSSNTSFTGTVTGFVNTDNQGNATSGTLSFTSSTTPTSNAGSYAINGAGLTAANYSFVQAGGNATALTINPAILTYVATAANSTYGSTPPGFTGTVTGFVNADDQSNATTGTLSFGSTATATSNAGSYAINGSGLTANNGNYTFEQAAGNATALTVNPATLTYVATAANSTYGSSPAGLTGTVTGFVNTDNQNNATTGTLSFSSTATSASNAGGYAINGSGLAADNGNYTFIQAGGNATALTINPASLTITAGTATKTYGSTTLSFAGPQFATSGLVNSDTVTGVNLTSAGQAATAGVNSGTPYALTASAATGSGLSNYTITYHPGTVTVSPATLTLTALDQTVNFGSSVNLTPTLNTNYTVAGLQNSDQLAGVLATGPILATTQSTSAAGIFNGALTIAGTLNAGPGANYNLDLVNGNLTVENQAPLFNTFADEQIFNQFSLTGNTPNLDTFFDQANFPLAGNSSHHIYVATTNGEPPVDYYESSESSETGNQKGAHYWAHASSFTVPSP